MRDLREEVERFERRAPRYDRWWKQRWFFGPVHRRILAGLLPLHGERFLEVGCGTGNLTLAAVRRTGRAVGVDPTFGMVARARGKAGETLHPTMRAWFVVGAAEALPFPEAWFHVAATSISMHHWADPDAGLRELHRVLRPAGRLLVADMAPRGRGRVLAFLTGLGRHPTLWTAERLGEALRQAGFVRIRMLRRGYPSRLVVFLSAERGD